jgi:hypothetical protein
MAAEALFIDFEIVCERQQHGWNDACWNERHEELLDCATARPILMPMPAKRQTAVRPNYAVPAN